MAKLLSLLFHLSLLNRIFLKPLTSEYLDRILDSLVGIMDPLGLDHLVGLVEDDVDVVKNTLLLKLTAVWVSAIVPLKLLNCFLHSHSLRVPVFSSYFMRQLFYAMRSK